MTEDPCLLSAAEAGRRIAADVKALLARIAAAGDRVHASITVLAEPALAADRKAQVEIAAFATRHGLAALTPALLARMAILARTVAKAAAGLPRVTDQFAEPMPVFRVRG